MVSASVLPFESVHQDLDAFVLVLLFSLQLLQSFFAQVEGLQTQVLLNLTALSPQPIRDDLEDIKEVLARKCLKQDSLPDSVVKVVSNLVLVLPQRRAEPLNDAVELVPWLFDANQVSQDFEPH